MKKGMINYQITTTSAEETKKSAKKILQQFPEMRVFYLIGDLGSGKTTFVQGIAMALGIKEMISSPTFVIMKQYNIPRSRKTLYHVDLYRLQKVDQDMLFSLEELFHSKNSYVLIEWADKLSQHLYPPHMVTVHFSYNNSPTRHISITPNFGKNKRKMI